MSDLREHPWDFGNICRIFGNIGRIFGSIGRVFWNICGIFGCIFGVFPAYAVEIRTPFVKTGFIGKDIHKVIRPLFVGSVILIDINLKIAEGVAVVSVVSMLLVKT